MPVTTPSNAVLQLYPPWLLDAVQLLMGIGLPEGESIGHVCTRWANDDLLIPKTQETVENISIKCMIPVFSQSLHTTFCT